MSPLSRMMFCLPSFTLSLSFKSHPKIKKKEADAFRHYCALHSAFEMCQRQSGYLFFFFCVGVRTDDVFQLRVRIARRLSLISVKQLQSTSAKRAHGMVPFFYFLQSTMT